MRIPASILHNACNALSGGRAMFVPVPALPLVDEGFGLLLRETSPRIDERGESA